MVQRVHNLLDRGVEVPPMNVQNIDVRGAKFLERVFDREEERLGIVPAVIGLDLEGGRRDEAFVVEGVLEDANYGERLIEWSGR